MVLIFETVKSWKQWGGNDF